jgi:hypothetical protein
MSLANRRSGLGLKTDATEYFSRGNRKDSVATATRTQLVAAIRSYRIIERPVPVLLPPPGRMGGEPLAPAVTTLYVVAGYVDPDYVE